jgi:hypothetical protein
LSLCELGAHERHFSLCLQLVLALSSCNTCYFLEFYIYDVHFLQDVIHVVESKPTKRHGDYFLRQILKVSTHPSLSGHSSRRRFSLLLLLNLTCFPFVAV